MQERKAVPDYARQVIRNSIKPNTYEAYNSQRSTFKAWQKDKGHESEMEGYLAYCAEKESQGKPSASMATLYYAIKKNYVLTGTSDSAWIEEPWVTAFVKGLKYEGGTGKQKVRLGLSLEMQRSLVGRAKEQGRPELATGYGVMFRALLRHDHIPRMRADQIIFHDDTPLGEPYAKAWCSGFKGEGDFKEGQWVKVIGLNEDLKEQVRKATEKGSSILFPEWEENLAVSFLQNTAHCLRWPSGFKYDVHCLRVGGANEQEIRGASVKDLRIQGRWKSDVVHDYRGIMAPGQGKKPLSPRSAPKIRRGKRRRIVEKASNSKNVERGRAVLECKKGDNAIKVKVVRGKDGRVMTVLL